MKKAMNLLYILENRGMEMNNYYCVITFHTTQQPLVFEKTLKNEGMNIKLMPVPRQVSSSCGIAARVDCDKKEKILSICKENNIEIEGFHTIEKSRSSKWF